MLQHEGARPDTPYYGLYTGIVLERDDPLKLGRVRVQIPGLVDEGTAWALPLTFGGGTKQRGAIFTPPLGAEVGVLFRMGDIDQPYYLGGNLGVGEELTGTDGHPDAHAIETEHYVVLIDDRPESKSVTFLDKASGDCIQLNGVQRAITIKATSLVTIEAQGFIHINGLEVFINGIQAGLGKL
jgi:Type VI secretion system/phage-baseplate injector OB domain